MTKPSVSKRKYEESESRKSKGTNHEGTSTMNNVVSIIVCDRGTQCNFESNRFDSAENSQVVKQLMKNLQGMVRDEQGQKTVNTVEQILRNALSTAGGKRLANVKFERSYLGDFILKNWEKCQMFHFVFKLNFNSKEVYHLII